jgi:hypothetical protein
MDGAIGCSGKRDGFRHLPLSPALSPFSEYRKWGEGESRRERGGRRAGFRSTENGERERVEGREEGGELGFGVPKTGRGRVGYGGSSI